MMLLPLPQPLLLPLPSPHPAAAQGPPLAAPPAHASPAALLPPSRQLPPQPPPCADPPQGWLRPIRSQQRPMRGAGQRRGRRCHSLLPSRGGVGWRRRCLPPPSSAGPSIWARQGGPSQSCLQAGGQAGQAVGATLQWLEVSKVRLQLAGPRCRVQPSPARLGRPAAGAAGAACNSRGVPCRDPASSRLLRSWLPPRPRPLSPEAARLPAWSSKSC